MPPSTSPPRRGRLRVATVCGTAGLLLLAGWHCAVADDTTTWGCRMKFDNSRSDCSLKVVRTNDGVRYNLLYGDSRTSQLDNLEKSGQPEHEQVNFTSTLWGKSFSCSMTRKASGSYKGDCERTEADGNAETFELRLTHPNARSLVPTSEEAGEGNGEQDTAKVEDDASTKQEKNDDKAGEKDQDRKDRKKKSN